MICTAKREWVFGAIDDGTMRLSGNGIIADNEIKKLYTHYSIVQIANHVVMPNHVHPIVAIMGVKATGSFVAVLQISDCVLSLIVLYS